MPTDISFDTDTLSAEITKTREQQRKRTLRAAARAFERRRELVRVLGGVCALCDSRKRLEIDHVNGRTWDVAQLSHWSRVKRYWEEYERGTKLRVLCRSCNGRLGGKKTGQP